MFPQTTSEVQPAATSTLSASLVVLGGKVEVLVTGVGFPEPEVRVGE